MKVKVVASQDHINHYYLGGVVSNGDLINVYDSLSNDTEYCFKIDYGSFSGIEWFIPKSYVEPV